MSKPVILTGVRSNALPTLGNYLGAILPLVRLQKNYSNEYQINAFLPDLHSITSSTELKQLYQNTVNNLRIYAAAGLDLDNKNTSVYRQSYIPAHSELTWILDCFVYYGELLRMTQFKEKSTNQNSVNVSLLNYPVLMTADILLYDASYIPVGEDQKQHLELARDIAVRMNNLFGDLFTVPKSWEEQLKFNGNGAGVRIRSLKHPNLKMSKSIEDPAGTILITEEPSKAREKVLSATTDSLGSVDFNYETQPGISNLLQIIATIRDKPVHEILKDWKGESSYAKLKQATADLVEETLFNFQANFNNFNHDDAVSTLLKHEERIRAVADAKLSRVQSCVGLRP